MVQKAAGKDRVCCVLAAEKRGLEQRGTRREVIGAEQWQVRVDWCRAAPGKR